jgi:PelA/Pel-15E family pectate lyase
MLFPRFIPRALLALFLAGGACGGAGLQPIDLSGFGSGIGHWRNIRDTNRFIQAEPGQPSYQPAQVREIAANILLFQRANGGWPKDYDMTAVLTGAQRRRVIETHANSDTSYDNGNIHSQIRYLAAAYGQQAEPEWRASCERGLEFVLSSQYAHGGFPQRFPGAKSYHAHITLNDGAMMGCLNLLKDVAEGKAPFTWLDDVRRGRARVAVSRGVDCLLRCQIVVAGRRTGWCQQHDEKTFEARPARTFELASICPLETTEVARFLMWLDKPSPEVIAAVDAAVAWLDSARLGGIRVARVKAEKEEFLRHTADFDIVVVPDAAAPPLWARHYEIGTDRPVFAGRDGVKKYALADIERERRTGTAWYGGWPEKLLGSEHAAWKQRVAEVK